MLAIAQAGQQFHYLSWTPTTTKPVLNGFGTKSYEKTDLSSSDFFSSLFSELIELNKLSIPRIYVSLDMDTVHLSETQIPTDSDFENYQNWLNATNYDSEFSKRFETYYYPFDNKIEKSFNVHIPLPIKRALISAIKKNNAELRFLSLGVFSAESCVRSIYNSEKLDSYIVWRVGQYNFNEILWIKKSQLICFLRFKNMNNTFKVQNYYGCSKSADKILNQLEKCTNNDYSNFKISDQIFIYSNTKNNADFLKITKSPNSQFKSIDILNRFQSKNKNSNSFVFAETGLVFRGFDV